MRAYDLHFFSGCQKSKKTFSPFSLCSVSFFIFFVFRGGGCSIFVLFCSVCFGFVWALEGLG